eukprot:3932378-Rhodomonas_salina.1
MLSSYAADTLSSYAADTGCVTADTGRAVLTTRAGCYQVDDQLVKVNGMSTRNLKNSPKPAALRSDAKPGERAHPEPRCILLMTPQSQSRSESPGHGLGRDEVGFKLVMECDGVSKRTPSALTASETIRDPPRVIHVRSRLMARILTLLAGTCLLFQTAAA